MFYSSQAPELRAFLRDKLNLPCTDVGGGWLIFDLPEAEMGCHEDKTDTTSVPSGTPHISFYCDDIHRTVSELKARGVEFVGGITETGWGLVTRFRVPGDFEIDLYEPRYTKQPGRKKKENG